MNMDTQASMIRAMKLPRDVVRLPGQVLATVAGFLPGGKPYRGPRPAERGGKEYAVDELARAADTTVRNVRAYQDRGLLAPPERRGRSGIYTETHLSRLRIIGQLLERGYTLASIADLFSAIEHGHDLADLLGLE